MPIMLMFSPWRVARGAWHYRQFLPRRGYRAPAVYGERRSRFASHALRKAASRGIVSALLSAKKKTISLLPRGAKIVLSAETPLPNGPSISGRRPTSTAPKSTIGCSRLRSGSYGISPTSAYSTSTRPTIRCTCGRPKIRVARHLAGLDALLGELEQTAPDAAILLTADHGMNHKTRCWDLESAFPPVVLRYGPRSRPNRTNTSSTTVVMAGPRGSISSLLATLTAWRISSRNSRA